MANNTLDKRSNTYQQLIKALFLVLILSFSLFITVFWTLWLEPQLVARADVTARSVVMSNLGPIKNVLEMKSEDPSEQNAETMNSLIGRLLILTDSESGAPFISGIDLVFDYDVVHIKQGSMDIRMGTFGNDDRRLDEIPLYSDKTKELQGVLRYRVNSTFVSQFIKRIKLTFFAGAVGGMLLLIAAWGIAAAMMVRVRVTETALEEKKAQVIHAGRLTALGEMATGIAHELNQPLAIIRIASEGLLSWFTENHSTETMEKKAAETIGAQVERARNIIDHMRSFARTDGAICQLTGITEPVNNALSFFKEQFRQHGIQLNLILPDHDIQVKADPRKLEQILVNLLSNARFAVDIKERLNGKDYDKTIGITVRPDSKSNLVVCEIWDNGLGMSSEEKQRCMEPFFTTKDVGEGTGLGLSIVHSIARESGMEIEIESELGKGSTFRIRIPQ